MQMSVKRETSWECFDGQRTGKEDGFTVFHDVFSLDLHGKSLAGLL